MDDYTDIPFILEDGSFDMTPCPARNTGIFLRHGLIKEDREQILDNNIRILPTHVLCPISYKNGYKNIKKDTVSIHHFSASWQSRDKRKEHIQQLRKIKRDDIKDRLIHMPNLILKKLLGDKRYEKLKKHIKGE